MAKILVVDDSALSRRISKRILVDGGHEVDVAGDGLSALEQYALQRPELVLLDVTMTEMNGLEVFRQLRAMDAKARVVMATADVQASTREIASELGAVGFIAKPFVAAPLLETVAEALATPGDRA